MIAPTSPGYPTCPRNPLGSTIRQAQRKERVGSARRRGRAPPPGWTGGGRGRVGMPGRGRPCPNPAHAAAPHQHKASEQTGPRASRLVVAGGSAGRDGEGWQGTWRSPPVAEAGPHAPSIVQPIFVSSPITAIRWNCTSGIPWQKSGPNERDDQRCQVEATTCMQDGREEGWGCVRCLRRGRAAPRGSTAACTAS